MEANVQSGPLVTGAEPYKPKATLWHKGSGSGGNLEWKTSCVCCTDYMMDTRFLDIERIIGG